MIPRVVQSEGAPLSVSRLHMGNISGNLYCKSDFRKSSGKSPKYASQSAVEFSRRHAGLEGPRLRVHRGLWTTYGLSFGLAVKTC